MSKADEMVEKLGYEKYHEDEKDLIYVRYGLWVDDIIRISKACQTFKFETNSCASEWIGLEELEAIEEKIKELGVERW